MKFRNFFLTGVILFISNSANAAQITSFLLTDFDGDGLESDFKLNGTPTGNSSLQFTSEHGPIIAGIEMEAGTFANSVSLGATWGEFFVGNSDGTGSISGDITNGFLSFSSFDFGLAQYQNTTIDGVVNSRIVSTAYVTPFPDLSAPDSIIWSAIDMGNGDWGVILEFSDRTNNVNETFSYWRMEGILSTNSIAAVPVPAAIWLFASGLLGLVGIARRKQA